jgi:hypothetical protein
MFNGRPTFCTPWIFIIYTNNHLLLIFAPFRFFILSLTQIKCIYKSDISMILEFFFLAPYMLLGPHKFQNTSIFGSRKIWFLGYEINIFSFRRKRNSVLPQIETLSRISNFFPLKKPIFRFLQTKTTHFVFYETKSLPSFSSLQTRSPSFPTLRNGLIWTRYIVEEVNQFD